MCLGRPPELIERLTFPISITYFRGNFCFSNVFLYFRYLLQVGWNHRPEKNHHLPCALKLSCLGYMFVLLSGQIIATSHDRFPPNGGLVRDIPLFQGNLGWWTIIIRPKLLCMLHVHLLLYCDIWRTAWSIPLIIPNCFFPRKKKHPWSWKNVWDICRQPFWSLDSLDFGCSRWVGPTRVLSGVRCFYSHGFFSIIHHVLSFKTLIKVMDFKWSSNFCSWLKSWTSKTFVPKINQRILIWIIEFLISSKKYGKLCSWFFFKMSVRFSN